LSNLVDRKADTEAIDLTGLWQALVGFQPICDEYEALEDGFFKIIPAESSRKLSKPSQIQLHELTQKSNVELKGTSLAAKIESLIPGKEHLFILQMEALHVGEAIRLGTECVPQQLWIFWNRASGDK
jgi:hypothetical protein